jgi:hypothetical protein
VAVVSVAWHPGHERPWAEAVIVAEPGVVVVTALATTYSLPAGIVIVEGTETMFV